MQTIINQFNEMINRNIVPCFEFELPDNEYLVVNIQLSDDGIYFTFDEDNKHVYFDGEIVKKGDAYLLPFDEYVEDLDEYLQMISDNIVEGYLIPNNLYV